MKRLQFDDSFIWLLVFSFLCGSLLSLLYIPSDARIYMLDGEQLIAPVIFCAVAVAVFSPSVCGGFMLPIIFTGLGLISALNTSGMILEFSSSPDAAYQRAVAAAVLAPLMFLFGVWGMTTARAVRRAVIKDGSISKLQLVSMYIAMTASMAAIALLVINLIYK